MMLVKGGTISVRVGGSCRFSRRRIKRAAPVAVVVSIAVVVGEVVTVGGVVPIVAVMETIIVVLGAGEGGIMMMVVGSEVSVGVEGTSGAGLVVGVSCLLPNSTSRPSTSAPATGGVVQANTVVTMGSRYTVDASG